MCHIPRVVVAGLKGGSGKTTFSLGILSLLRTKGRRVAPFKKGPDYIDAGWLARAAARSCRNLDAFLFPEENVRLSFAKGVREADGALIEGNRGIFDGIDEEGTFSTARLARIFSAPVILLVDCTKVTTTVAALVKGVISFDRDLALGGVVLNQLAGGRHEAVIRKAVEQHAGVRVLGALGRKHGELMPERHMGLVPFQESSHVADTLDRIADVIRQGVDVEAVLGVMESAAPLELPPVAAKSEVSHDVRIGVLRDAAFQFYYPDNLEALGDAGAQVVQIDALTADELPDVDALYIGGGFPETQAVALSENRGLLAQIRNSAKAGLPIYAECGGLMFLGRCIEVGKRKFEMVGALPLEFSMRRRPAAHGYTIAEVVEENPYYARGTQIRGHEFHYSSATVVDATARFSFRMKRGCGIVDGRDGIVSGNVFGTYTHVHALGSPQWAAGMVAAARGYREMGRGTV